MQTAAVGREAAKHDVGHIRRWCQRIGNGGNRNARRAVGGKTINAGGNRGEGHGRQHVGLTEFERATVAGGEQLIFAIVAAVPDWPDGVDHTPCRQPVPQRNFGIAGRATV